jgi:hypothetical protein
MLAIRTVIIHQKSIFKYPDIVLFGSLLSTECFIVYIFILHIMNPCVQLLFSRGELVELLISSNIARYTEFRNVSRVVTWAEGELTAVPCSRADVFATKNISVVEKRMLMGLLTECTEYENNPDKLKGMTLDLCFLVSNVSSALTFCKISKSRGTETNNQLTIKIPLIRMSSMNRFHQYQILLLLNCLFKYLFDLNIIIVLKIFWVI